MPGARLRQGILPELLPRAGSQCVAQAATEATSLARPDLRFAAWFL